MSVTNPFLTLLTVPEYRLLNHSQPFYKGKSFELVANNKHLINSKESFLDAVYSSLPLPPHGSKSISRQNWDALADDFYYLHHLNYKRVHLIWLFADDSAASSIAFMIKAVKFLKYVADGLSSGHYYIDGHEKFLELTLILVCSNDQSRQKLKNEFWFLNSN